MSVAERSAAYRARRKPRSRPRQGAGCPHPLSPAGGQAQQAEAVAGRGGDAGGPDRGLSGLAGRPAGQPTGSDLADRLDEVLQLAIWWTSSPQPSCPRASGATDMAGTTRAHRPGRVRHAREVGHRPLPARARSAHAKGRGFVGARQPSLAHRAEANWPRPPPPPAHDRSAVPAGRDRPRRGVIGASICTCVQVGPSARAGAAPAPDKIFWQRRPRLPIASSHATLLHNARIQLLATLLNTMAGTSFTVGIAAPIAAGIFYGQAIPAHAVMIGAIVWAVQLFACTSSPRSCLNGCDD